MASSFTQQISDPYAEALLSVATDQNLLNTFANDVRLVQAVLESTPELRQFLANPVIKADDKKQFLEQVFGKRIHPLLLNTLKLLTDRRRIVVLDSVCARFLELQRRLQKIALAEVVSAVELSEAQKRAIQDQVRRMHQVNSVELQTRLDADLIGGVLIKVGSQVIDLSLRGQLRRLALQLAS